MLHDLATAIGGTVHDTSDAGSVIVAGDYIVTCRLTGKVRAQHRSRPGTYTLGVVRDGVDALARAFAALP